MTPCHCSDMELTFARFQLLKEQRKEDSLYCEQDMRFKERSVVFAIASDLPSLHLETREAASTPAHPHNIATPTFSRIVTCAFATQTRHDFDVTAAYCLVLRATKYRDVMGTRV